MSYNGSGTFLINTAGQPVVSGTVISSTAFNALTADLATGLSTAITKDGQTTVTANIPMSTYKFTGLGAGSAATDSANLSQVQSTVSKLLNSVSGADTITATASPTLAAYAAGQMFYFVAAGNNTTSVTLNIDGLGAKAVTRDGSTALISGDIKSGEVVVVVYDGTRFQVVSQVNSAGDATFANVSITSALNVGGVATFTSNPVLSAGAANGVAYLNGSKVLTAGSALTFDGTQTFSLFASGNAVTNLEGSTTNNAILRFRNGTTGALAGFYGNNSKELVFEANGTTEQMRLTSTGLGLGTSSPSNTAGFSRQLQIEGTTAALTLSGTTGTGKYTFGVPGVNAIGLWDNTASAYRWYVDSSGNLGLGTTSPGSKLEISAANPVFTIYNTSTGDNGITWESDAAAGASRASLFLNYANAELRMTAGAGGGSYFQSFYTNGSERARIASGGQLLVGTTNTAGSAGVGIKLHPDGLVATVSTTSISDSYNYYNSTAGAYRFYVTNGGTVFATNTTISAISDQRLKENIRDLDAGLDAVMALKPRKFDWKEGKGQDKKDVRGFIAQEFEQVFPDLIDTWKDPAPEGEEPYKAVRADLIPVLVKAMQEQQAMIETLKAEVAALKGA